MPALRASGIALQQQRGAFRLKVLRPRHGHSRLVACKRACERYRNPSGIALDANLDGEEPADRRGIDLDLDDSRCAVEVVPRIERSVETKPCSNREDYVCLSRERRGDDVAAWPDLSGIKGVRA